MGLLHHEGVAEKEQHEEIKKVKSNEKLVDEMVKESRTAGRGLKSHHSDALVALCNRADSSEGKGTRVSVTSSEARKLIPDLNQYGLDKASKKLRRSIYVDDGELIIYPRSTETKKAKKKAQKAEEPTAAAV